MVVVVEAFVEAHDTEEIADFESKDWLRCFGEYVDDLGTQPVTVTISSVVEDMLGSYHDVTHDLESFSWKQNLASVIEEFVHTRDCFFHSPGHAPFLECTFSVLSYGRAELDIQLNLSWNPPVIGFYDLCNVVPEGHSFSLRPKFTFHDRHGSLPVSKEYFAGPGDSWLRWDAEGERFQGTVPKRIASDIGAERFEAYTVPLEMTARVTKYFPAGIRMEKVFRVALPLTVKRQPSSCACYDEMAGSPTIARKTGSRVLRNKAGLGRIPRSSENSKYWDSTLGTTRNRLPLMKSSPKGFRRTLDRSSPSSRFHHNYAKMHGDANMHGRNDKENHGLNPETVSKLLELKAEGPSPPSPTRLNALSLARLHEATTHSALAHPPVQIVEVRGFYSVNTSMSGATADPVHDVENAHPHTPGNKRAVKVSDTALRIPSNHSRDEVLSEMHFRDLGSTHINRRGDLASRSGSEDDEDAAKGPSTPSTRNVTPPAGSRDSASISASVRSQWVPGKLDESSPSKRLETKKRRAVDFSEEWWEEMLIKRSTAPFPREGPSKPSPTSDRGPVDETDARVDTPLIASEVPPTHSCKSPFCRSYKHRRNRMGKAPIAAHQETSPRTQSPPTPDAHQEPKSRVPWPGAAPRDQRVSSSNAPYYHTYPRHHTGDTAPSALTNTQTGRWSENGDFQWDKFGTAELYRESQMDEWQKVIQGNWREFMGGLSGGGVAETASYRESELDEWQEVIQGNWKEFMGGLGQGESKVADEDLLEMGDLETGSGDEANEEGEGEDEGADE